MQENYVTRIIAQYLLAAWVIIWTAGCLPFSGDPAASASTFDAGVQIAAGEREVYENRYGGIKCSFVIPESAWKKIAHGLKTLQDDHRDSDVYIYSPSEDHIPGFKIIAFTRKKLYPEPRRDAIAERKALWRENKMKELYPGRFLGRVEFGKTEISGLTVPKVVYDMHDASKSRIIRSTEYTLVSGRSAVTLQFINDKTSPDTDRILDRIFESLTIETSL